MYHSAGEGSVLLVETSAMGFNLALCRDTTSGSVAPGCESVFLGSALPERRSPIKRAVGHKNMMQYRLTGLQVDPLLLNPSQVQ